MEFIDYLSLDITEQNNIKPIVIYVLDELEKLKESNFDIDGIHTLNGALHKFGDLTSHFGSSIVEEIGSLGEQLVTTAIQNNGGNPNQIKKSCTPFFEKIYSIIIMNYNIILQQTINSKWHSDFEIIYNPDKSNKEKSLELLNEVRDLIKNDKDLPDKYRNSIISKIDSIIKDLSKENTNWTSYFGKTSQLMSAAT